MKTSLHTFLVFTLLVFLATGLTSGCSVIEENHTDIRLTVGESFDNDRVRLLIDGHEVFSNTLTSTLRQQPPVCCGPSAVVVWPVTRGEHSVLIEINGEEKGRYDFDSWSWRFISISYDPETDRLYVSGRADEPPEYEG